MRTDGQTDRHDEATSRFSHFANVLKNDGNTIKLYRCYHVLDTLRTRDADLRFKRGETRYTCKFSLVPLHKGESFQRYRTLKHY